MSTPRDASRSAGVGRPAEGDDASTLDAPDPSDAPDSFDDILRRVVRPGGDAPGLERGSELVGRFRITRVLGAGGMGTVYVARDATLGREVAIKVHHAASGARRLRREAVAMARLAHPNVVTVFEVGDIGGRPFVVMEYIAGTTLRAHLAAAPRSVRDIVALLVAAGEGLAAAHDAGLVHRDVKPENVLVGADGRARVGDFGLARDRGAREPESSDDGPGAPIEESSPSVEDLRAPVTQTGAVMGTPAYMAPEQFAGAPVDARADQFAFCVTAWEALWGERPFAPQRSSYAQLSAASGLGERRAPPAAPRVPARIRAALERGLAIDPAARFATMHDLLGAMRPPRRELWRWLAAGAALAIAAACAALVLRGDPGPACDIAGDADLAGMRTDLAGALQQHGAPQIATRVEALAHDWAARFKTHAQKACEAGADHQWSPEIVARSRQCFAAVGRTTALLLASADPAHPLDVLRRVRRLPPEDHCSNPTHLAARPALPADPARLAALTEATALLAAGLDAIEDHDAAGLGRALAAIEASPSPARDDAGITAGLGVLRGSLAYGAGHLAEARKQFTEAYYAARALDDDQIASAALDLLIELGPELELAPEAIHGWLRTALADADRIRARSPWLAGRIYTVAARAADLASDAPTALAFVARARSALDDHDPVWIESFSTEGSVLMWSGHVDDGIRAYESAIAQKAAYVGGDDPELASLLSDYASSLLEVQHLEDAMRAADRAFQIVAGAADPDDDRLDPIRITLAAVLIGASQENQDDVARGLLEIARAHSVRRLGEASTVVASIDTNLAAIYNARGDHDQAIAALSSAIATDEKLLGKDRIEVASALYNLAAAYRDKGDHARALAAARRAAAIWQARSPGSDRHRLALTMAASAGNASREFAVALALADEALGFPLPAQSAQTPAWSHVERARALIGLGRAAEAGPDLDAARTGYTAVHMSDRVKQVDDLLSGLPRR